MVETPVVPAVFQANPNELYRISSVANVAKSFTVAAAQNNKLTISDYVADGSQKFHIYQ